MAFPFDVKTHTRQVPGLPGESADATRMAQIEADQATILARPAITELGAVPNVDDTGVTDGDTLVYDSSANGGLGGYVAGTPNIGVPYIKKGASVILTGADRLNFDTGLNVQQDGSIATQANVFVSFAGPGSANTVARSDHTHTVDGAGFVTYAAKGSLSSGSLTLATFNFVLADGIEYLVIGTVRATQRANGSESSYYTLNVNISGASRTSQTMQCVGFVPNSRSHSAATVMTGNGSAFAMTASIAYQSGVPVLVDAGDLMIQIFPRR